MKFPNIKSLYGQVFAIFWLTQLLVLIGVLVAQNYDPRLQRDLHPKLKTELNQFSQQIADALNAQTGTLGQKIESIERDHPTPYMRIYFTTPEGDLLPAKNNLPNRALKNFITLADDPTLPQKRVYGRRMFTGPFLIEHQPAPLYLYISKPWRQTPPFYIQVLDRPFQLLLVTMFMSTPLLLWFAWVVTRPARRLQEASERVARGGFETDQSLERGPSEFHQAGQSFNQMVAAINQMIGGQQRLLSDISHELRSPLTRLRMANALAMRKQGDSKELTRIELETQRMEQMINDLLALSRIQLDGHVHRDEIALTALWQPLLDDAQFEASQRGKVLESNAIVPMMITGNASLLYSGFENVVRNAIKYAQHQIDVRFNLLPQQLVIEISDDGEGVPEEMLTEIFRPFYRVSSARDRESGGTGLGLAITDTAMRQHQGHASALINAKGGLTVQLCLPRQNKGFTVKPRQ